MSEEILYQGPNREYDPTDGANRERVLTASKFLAPTTTADIDQLRQLLVLIRRESNTWILLMEEELNQLVLRVKSDSGDDKLREAMVQEWPNALGAVQDVVPYQYYKALQFRDTASSTYIRDRWQSAARDVGGNRAFDLILPLYMIKSEVDFIEGFLVEYIGDVNDSSEERIVELFQEWATVALAAVRKIAKEYQTPDTARHLTEEELKTVTPAEATNYQALFKAKVNALNTTVDQEVSLLKKNWAATSDYFYNRALGPALRFRLKTSRKVYPGSGRLAKIASQTAESMNSNLSFLITDLMRRNEIFVSKINSFNDATALRDTYRTYVAQLAPRAERDVPNTVIKSPTPLNPDEWFDAVVENATPNTYGAYHNKLLGIEEVDAHPHYLDRMGRNKIEGNIEVAPGVKIDGIDLNKHQHNGQDGSARIQGSDIEGLVADSIERNVIVDPPVELRLVKTQSSVTGRTVDAHIAWDGYQEHLYDVQITPIENKDDDGFGIVHEGIPATSYSVGIETYDGSYFYVPRITDFDDEAGGTATVVKIVPNVSETTHFTLLDLLNFYLSELGIGDEVEPAAAIYVGLQDGEIMANGDYYVAGPATLAGATDFDEAPVPMIVKHDAATGEFVSMYRVASDDEVLESKFYNSITFDPSREKFYIQGVQMDLDTEPDPPYEMLVFTGELGDTVVEELGPRVPNGPAILLASDYCSDGYVYGVGLVGLGSEEDDELALLRLDPETGIVTVIEGTEPIPVVGEIPLMGFVALENEFLFTSGFQIFSFNKDLTQSVNLTATFGFSFYGTGAPIGLCKDKYGRVYTATLPTNDIYRICGPRGTGTFS